MRHPVWVTGGKLALCCREEPSNPAEDRGQLQLAMAISIDVSEYKQIDAWYVVILRSDK